MRQKIVEFFKSLRPHEDNFGANRDLPILASTITGASTVAVPTIAVENIPEDKPKWERHYIVKLDDRASMKIQAKSLYGRSFWGELTQPNGRWVFFDPDAVADKILDPTLVPIIERYVREIKKLDREFMASNRDKFLDEGGICWKRLSA